MKDDTSERAAVAERAQRLHEEALAAHVEEDLGLSLAAVQASLADYVEAVVRTTLAGVLFERQTSLEVIERVLLTQTANASLSGNTMLACAYTVAQVVLFSRHH